MARINVTGARDPAARPCQTPGRPDMDGSDISPSPAKRGRCFCGQKVGSDGGIYCSLACARSDSLSSLCYKPSLIPLPPLQNRPPSLASSISSSLSSLSRNPSSASTASTISNTSTEEWNASHYRRLAHADMRREERREERRRRRAEGNGLTTLSTTSSVRTPELISGHCRNPSNASTSTTSSAWGSSLSRNPSSASSASVSSRLGHGGGMSVGDAIMEDDDEAEWLLVANDKPYAPTIRKHGHKRKGSGFSSAKQKKLETSFGMGKDMRDVLEEIISLEKEFMVDVDDEERLDPPPTGLFTSTFDRPPRTPSPGVNRDRNSIVPSAPGAPARGRRNSLMNGRSHGSRTPSMMGLHQSSLSESHTALYLATASPVKAGRRSASPTLEARKSITFSPDAAGPTIAALASHSHLSAPRRLDSPSVTPSRRRISALAVHPTIDNWRFPSPNPNAATPTGQHASEHASEHLTPIRGDRVPNLLWPPPAPPLAPALFPCSPAAATPEFLGTASNAQLRSSPTPQGSGMKFGVLLGSNEDDDMDVDDASHYGNGASNFLPVFLEAEGFKAVC